jgi:hypothetical protein
MSGAGNKRRSHDRTALAQLNDLAIDAVAAASGLLAKLQPLLILRQLPDELLYVERRVRNRPYKLNVAVATVFGQTNGNRRLVNIKADILYALHDPPLGYD